MVNKVIYDALSFTSKIHSTKEIIEALGLENASWQVVKGSHGYRDRLYFDYISIHYNGTDEMGIWCELTGQGCRTFETLGNGNYDAIFAEILSEPEGMNITRLDVAFDDHDGILDLALIAIDTKEQNYISRFKDWQIIEGNKDFSINHGSMKSEIFIRIYDKALERGYTDGRHWVRVELQMRRDRARKYIEIGKDSGATFSSVLNTYLRYCYSDGGQI